MRLFGAGDSRFADGRQGTPPYDSGYVLHRYSALNLAVWGLRGKVVHDARTDLFATAGCTLEQWIDAHLAGLLAAMAEAAQPGRADPPRHPQPALGRPGRHAGPGQPDHRRPDRRRRPHPLAPGEPPLRRQRARARERGEAPRLQRLAPGAGRRPRRAGSGRSTTCRPSPPTASPPATPPAPASSATACTTPRPAPSSRPPPPAPSSRPCRRSFPRAEYPGAAAAWDAAANPGGNRLDPAGWTGEVRSADDSGRGVEPRLHLLHRDLRRPHLVGDAARRHRRQRRACPPLPGALRHRLRRRRHRALPRAGGLGEPRGRPRGQGRPLPLRRGLLRHQRRQRRRRPRPGRRARGGPGRHHGAEREPQPSSR